MGGEFGDGSGTSSRTVTSPANVVLELEECCNAGGSAAAGEFLRQSSIRGDGDNLDGVEPADEVEGAAREEVGYGDDAGVVVAVEGGVVVVDGGSGSGGDFGTVFGRTAGLRVGAAACLAGSGLDRRVAPEPDGLGFGRRRRSVEEGPRAAARSLEDRVVRIGCWSCCCCGCCLTCCVAVGTTCFSLEAIDAGLLLELRSRCWCGFRDG